MRISDWSSDVCSSDLVNEYIHEVMGEDFTAKHFRTWTASAIAYEILVLAGEEGVSLRDLLTPVAAALGNTPAIARKSYVHPALIALAKKGKHANLPRCRGSKYLSASERGLTAFLEILPG